VEINIRNKNTYSGEGEFIGRPSPLENPYKITKSRSRRTAIVMYAQYITDAIMNEGFASEDHEEIISELNRLFKILINNQKLDLICYCSPLECHGDIIKQLLLNQYHTGFWLVNKKIGIDKYDINR
jgi:hypothetical protein